MESGSLELQVFLKRYPESCPLSWTSGFPKPAFPLEKPLVLSWAGLAKIVRGNTASIFVFPWEREIIRENDQIPKESVPRGFLISVRDMKGPFGTGFISLNWWFLSTFLFLIWVVWLLGRAEDPNSSYCFTCEGRGLANSRC